MVLTRSQRGRRPDDGAVAVLVAIVVVGVVLPLMALVVDLGLTRMLSRQSRGASDAAALGAAAVMRGGGGTTQAASEARALVQENLAAPTGGWVAAWTSCTDRAPLPSVPGPGSCISFDLTRNQVRVTVPQRPVPTVFAGVLGAHPPAASATTTATWGSGSATSSATSGGCALCVLGNYSGGVKAVQVSGGDAAIGGSLSTSSGGSLRVTGSGRVTAAGAVSGTGSVTPTAVAGPAPADPFASTLASLRTATPNGQPVYGQASGLPFGSCQPGIYQDVTFCTSFAPGTYFVTGRPSGSTVQVSLNGDASGVVLFFTCSGSSGGQVVARQCPSGVLPRFTGTLFGSHTLSAPGGGSNLALVFDAGLVRNERLNGTAQLTINGSVYGPGVTLRDGSSTSLTKVNGGRVVVGGVSYGTSNAGTMMLQVSGPSPGQQPAPDPVRLVPSG